MFRPLAVLFCLSLLLALSGCGNRAAPSGTKVIASPEALAERVDELDATVWKDEVAAQEHERFFIKFWDTLRNHDDPLGIFASVPVQSLSLPVAGTARTLAGLDILLTSFGGAGASLLDAGEYRATIALLKQQGWKLDQSEWHHAAFTPEKNGTPARSTFTFELHARKRAERAIARGHFDVTWGEAPTTAGIRVPSDIDIQELTVLRRAAVTPPTQIPVNIQAFSADRSVFVAPILCEDLEGDGTPEIVLVGVNQVLRYQDGTFNISPFLSTPPRQVRPATLYAELTGDGLPDFACVDIDGALLVYPGQADGTFGDRIEAWTAGAAREASLLAAGDIDGDHDLDLWLAQYRMPYLDAKLPRPFHDANDGAPSYLLRNDGKGRFTDHTEAAGLTDKRGRRTFSGSFIDYDADGDADLVTINDFSGIDVHENQGDGTFVDVTAARIDERALFGMGHQFLDRNHDGKPDLFAVGMSSTTVKRLESLRAGRAEHRELTAARVPMTYGNRMYEWSGQGWKQTVDSASIARTGWTWGSAFFDVDNDRDLDLYLCNGQYSGRTCRDYCTRYWTHDIYLGEEHELSAVRGFLQTNPQLKALMSGNMSWNGFEHNPLFVDSGDGQFVNVAWLYDLALETDHRCVVPEDIDGDGRLDFLLVDTRWLGGIEVERQRFTAHLNPFENDHHWIGVRLHSRVPGRHAIGSVIRITAGGRTHTHWVVNGESYRVQRAAAFHLGLGEGTAVERVEVVWSDGVKQVLEGPAIDRWHTLKANAVKAP